MLNVQGVSKAYGEIVALDRISMTINAGEIVALLGPNGAGKTTLVSLIAGLLTPDGGSILVEGTDARRSSRRPTIGLAPQELGVYPVLTVRENLLYFARLAGLRRVSAEREATNIADLMGLSSLLQRRADRLSGGERRRLHTGIAIVNRPRLLLLDEPTAGVDVGTRHDLLAVVNQLARDGSAVCYSTHYLAEVEELAPKVFILDHGCMIVSGSVEELIHRHGAGAIRLGFDRPAPAQRLKQLGLRAESSQSGETRITITGEEPTKLLSDALQKLGRDMSHLTAVDILRPSLETVFLRLTGRNFGSDVSDV